MKKSLPAFLALLIAIALSGQISAQLTINDANAALDINGMQPSVVDPANHLIPLNVTNVTNLDIHINSGPNANVGVILLASGSSITGPVLPVPWGDSIDIGMLNGMGGLTNVALVTDGVAFSANPLLDPFAVTDISGDYDYMGTVSPGLAALADPSVAVQAILQDPTAAPFFFDNTEAGDMSFFAGPALTSYTLGDDASVTHNLGIQIDFGGTLYSSVILNSNGFITFVAGSGDFTESMPEFFGGWGTPNNPGVALAYSDLNNGGTGSGATYDVLEDPVTGMVECQFNNQNWWSANSPAGSFKAIFNDIGTVAAGGVIADLTGLTPDPTNGDDFIIGVTDGDDSSLSGVGTDTDLSDGANTGFVNAIATGYTSIGLPDSVGELFQSALTTGTTGGAGDPPAVINFLHLGSFQWFIF